MDAYLAIVKRSGNKNRTPSNVYQERSVSLEYPTIQNSRDIVDRCMRVPDSNDWIRRTYK